MRSVYVMDDAPDRCTHCDLWEMGMGPNGVYHHYCVAQAHKMLDDDYVGKCLDEDCPLIPMPKRCEIDHEKYDDTTNAWGGGWNSCLNQFGGGDDE